MDLACDVRVGNNTVRRTSLAENGVSQGQVIC
jgi:hypothetical protein